MRLVSHMSDLDAVALLGTGLNADKVREIQQVAQHLPVYIALDADATSQAFVLARKWGSAFMSCRVVVLDKDIKDMSDDEIKALPL
jgi:DNA primase